MKVLFLYSEIATYFMSGVHALVEHHDAHVMIVRWPLNLEAPFQFSFGDRISVHSRKDLGVVDLLEISRDFDPDILFVSGWMDKGYMAVAKHFRKRGRPVILAIDNQWFGKARQHLATLLSPWIFHSRFSHIWVPGLFQYEYARRLGFPREKIMTGVYCSDQPRFYAAYEQFRAEKARNYPHTFLYVGRLSPEKGTLNLYHAFQKLTQEWQTDWKLIFVGTGPEGEKMQPLPQVEMRGFIQPEALPDLVKEGGCLVFPSLRDAWGVSIHEFAAAGLPLVITDAAGAITAFVREGYNGYIFERGQEKSLQDALRKIVSHSDQELLAMGDRSAQLSFQITPQSWAATLVGVGRWTDGRPLR